MTLNVVIMMNKLEQFELVKRELKLAKDNFDEALENLQKTCKHEKVVECEYKHNEYIASFPASRLCEICGTREDEKYGEYNILTTEYVKRVSRDTLYRIRDEILR